MPRALVGGVSLRYEMTGRGPDVVMVHGLAANLAFWFLNIAPRLAKEFRVIGYDLRGHGDSDMPIRGYTTEDMARDLEGLLKHLGGPRVHLVAHSFGGAVALHFALLHPERVRSLTLADARIHALQPLPSGEEGPFWLARRKRLRARGVLMADDTPKVYYTMLEELSADGQSGQGAHRGTIAGLGAWNPRGRAAQKWLALRATTSLATDVRRKCGLTKAAIRELRPPVCLMFGERSPCLGTLRSLQKLLPGVQAEMFSGVGHFFPAHVPALFAERVRRFLTSIQEAERWSGGG